MAWRTTRQAGTTQGVTMAARKKTKTATGRRRIDVHSHVIPAEVLQAIQKHPARFQMRFEQTEGRQRIVRDEIARWAKVIRRLGLTPH
jgi:hypothetical protein